jgi:hypothetical protein
LILQVDLVPSGSGRWGTSRLSISYPLGCKPDPDLGGEWVLADR